MAQWLSLSPLDRKVAGSSLVSATSSTCQRFESPWSFGGREGAGPCDCEVCGTLVVPPPPVGFWIVTSAGYLVHRRGPFSSRSAPVRQQEDRCEERRGDYPELYEGKTNLK